MVNADDASIIRLRQQDPEFDRWFREHQEYDRRLAEMSARTYLTPEEELEETRLKKLKLQLKDRMYARLAAAAREEQGGRQ
ncbi:MAG: DUF465 domain-containing protein [Deltaproteobacteria bacterium]|nr:DUF465 domain-containing protein [Candidatus Anaeroferrophillacea bacterium]